MKYWMVLMMFAANASPCCSQENPFSRMRLVSGNLNGKDYPAAAILFPVKAFGLETNLFMQLDTGAPVSFLYEGALKGQEKFLKRQGQQTILSIVVGEGTSVPWSFKTIAAVGIPVETNQEAVVGLLGVDFLLNRVMELDFSRERFRFRNTDPTNASFYQGVQSCPFSLDGNRIALTDVRIGKLKLTNVWYDSGASMFSVICPRTIWEKVTERTVSDPRNEVLQVPGAHQQPVDIVGASSKELLYIGGVPFLEYVLYCDLKDNSSSQPMLGNSLFLKTTIILDMKQKKFLWLPLPDNQNKMNVEPTSAGDVLKAAPEK